MQHPKFKDEIGDDWTLTLDVGAARRLKKECDLDVGSLADKDVFAAFYVRLGIDPVFLSDVLQELCAGQVEERGLTADDFDRRLAGDALDRAAAALVECVINFTSARFRPTLLALLRKTAEVEQAIHQENQQRLAAVDPRSLYGATSGGSPASSASGPTPTPTES